MDPVPVLAATFATTANTIDFLRNIQDAPVAIHELRTELLSLRPLLETIRESPELSTRVTPELEMANEVILQIARMLRKYGDIDVQKRNTSTRFRWAIRDKDKAKALRERLNGLVSRIALLLQVAKVESLRPQQSDENANASEIIIAVMGLTGSGKSSFIQKVTGSSDAMVGHSLKSETKAVNGYSILVEGRMITLVDTPGFDDTFRTDEEVLGELAAWLIQAYQSKKSLSGILFLHPITSTRMQGSMLKNFDVFEKLIGPDSFHKIVLVTTMWDLLPDTSIGESREEALREEFWKGLIEKGSITARSSGDRQSALAIVRRVAFDERLTATPAAPLAIQREIVDESLTLERTSAGEALLRMEQRHRDELLQIRNENDESIKVMQSEIATMRKQLREMGERAQDRQNTSLDVNQTPNPNVFVSVKTVELLDAALPPPYTLSATQSAKGVRALRELSDVIILSLTPIIEIYKYLQPVLARTFRPRLQTDYSRIEWICSCGDLLYDDYKELTPGSLHTLAIELGGKIVSGPAFQQRSGGSSTSSPGPSTQGSLAGGLTPTTAVSPPDRPAESRQQGKASRQSNDDDTAVAMAALRRRTAHRWLELAIRSSPDTFVLEEIDLTGRQTDQAVFQAIRTTYRDYRVAARLLGKFAYRVPTGGITAKFLKDKISGPRIVPTVDVLNRRTMPTHDEALRYSYVFDDFPATDPAIGTRTFYHYMSKPHLADPWEKWIRRFPKLYDVSYYYSQVPLGPGWGFEITESRNWMIFVILNSIGLLVSALGSWFGAWHLKDTVAGLTIGLLILTAQTLVNSALFWHWTG